MRRSAEERAAFAANAADRMRRWPTPAERRLWTILEPMGFLRQEPVCVPHSRNPVWAWVYVLDFYHAGRKLCVEVDGGYHKQRGGPDGRRDRRLQTVGIRTVRVTNQDVEKRLARVRQVLKEAMEEE